MPTDVLSRQNRTYLGAWTPLGRAVFRETDGELEPLPLPESAQLRGYTWGRQGSGPRDLARAILLDATANPMLAERLCRPFTWEVVSLLPVDGFKLTLEEVLTWTETRGSAS